MPVQLDIAGNFAAGQKATLDRRRAKQYERMNDYELAKMDEGMLGRRDNIRQQEEAYGLDPMQFSDLETNGDPMMMKLINWWKQRRAKRVMPSNMLPEQQQSVGDEMSQLGFEPDGFAMPEYKDGGKVKRGIPRYAEGGEVASEEEMIRRRAAANRARRPAEVTMRSETAIPRRPGMLSRAGGALRRVANSGAGKVVGGISAAGAMLDQTDADYDQRLQERFGFAPPTPAEGDQTVGGFAKFLGKRALGFASDLGNNLTMGMAGNAYRDQQGEGKPLGITITRGLGQPEVPAAIPKTPDEAIAQQAISEGTQMAEEAQQRSAPPGAVDFSQVDFEAGDIPNMLVKDWIDYRGRMVRNLMAQGSTPVDAHAQVTKLQQQGFVDYAQQSLMHLQSGNPNAAATALRAAYQYFPNGTDVQLGVQQGKDGQPVLVGQGRNEETGEPKGPPMILNAERLATMIENFSNPDAFRAWTKDWRDEQFNRQKFEEVEKPEAQSNATYRDRAGRAALRNADANVMDAQARAAGTGGSGRKQVDYDRANAAFTDAVNEGMIMNRLDDADPGELQAQADRLISIMAQIYEKSNWQYPQVIEFVRQAQTEGRLEEVAQALGLGE